MKQSPQQMRRPIASGCGATWSSACGLAVLLGTSACNSVLGIGEASLACDAPGCASDGAGQASSVDVNAAASDGEHGGPDGGNTPSGAGDGSTGAAGAAGSSGASRDGVPLVPMAPPSSGSSGGASANPPDGAAGGVAGAAGNAGAAPSSGAAGEPGQALCNAGDACGDCMCDACEEPLAACAATPGCLEIIACARNSGCSGFACYCGSIDLITCAVTDLADGPCIAVMMAAPGSHPPSVSVPNAGPASEAALSVANCSGQRCAAPCGS